ncbi:hypothetical protein NC653_024473 [Populus alba x Populus x berolinensis]|uniref:DUF4283 domain-containing protein n=1 Tax=Populus alba x Populus x berolinensis TaxID=444605 RepID=A0AAD6M8U5_9ROSI|nr:uncharacterized protein LOC118029754 [Populus alba]KAJ6981093.1 hypothetical protein NC653_024473 [Populus alba x Populus x berolinensis]
MFCPGISLSPVGATHVSPAIGTPQTGNSTSSPINDSPGSPHSLSPTLVHFPTYSSSASCHLQESDVSEIDVHWKHCLIEFVAGKCPGYAALLSYINRTWQHRASFTMHDSGWLIFTFSSESKMLDVLGAGPYAVFGRPLILRIMPAFFYFQFTELSSMPTWVRFPNLPLRCWNNICLSKIASMIGKPIKCDDPTALMTRVSYARILIEVDLLSILPSSVNVILPNGIALQQHIVYESLPRFCRQCKSLGHSTLICSKGLKSINKKRSHQPPTGSASPNPSVEIAAVVQQVQHCAGPSKDMQEDPMTTEAATAGVMSTQAPDRKRSKVAVTEPPQSISHHSAAIDTSSTTPPKRQYITRSKAVAIRQSKAPAAAFQYHHRPDDPTLLC